VLDVYLAPWSDRRRRAPAVIAPPQLVAATAYLANIEAEAFKAFDGDPLPEECQ
jgi:hypothetical protein